MKKFIPYEKMSKKQQKEVNQKKRNDWGLCKPVTRIIKTEKCYSRKIKHKGLISDDYRC